MYELALWPTQRVPSGQYCKIVLTLPPAFWRLSWLAIAFTSYSASSALRPLHFDSEFCFNMRFTIYLALASILVPCLLCMLLLSLSAICARKLALSVPLSLEMSLLLEGFSASALAGTQCTGPQRLCHAFFRPLPAPCGRLLCCLLCMPF